MTKERLKKFISENKDILIALGLSVVTVTAIILGVKCKPAISSTVSKAIQKGTKDIPVPSTFEIGKITCLWEEGGYLNAIIDGLTVSDLGRLGEEIVKHDLAATTSSVSVIMSIGK